MTTNEVPEPTTPDIEDAPTPDTDVPEPAEAEPNGTEGGEE